MLLAGSERQLQETARCLEAERDARRRLELRLQEEAGLRAVLHTIAILPGNVAFPSNRPFVLVLIDADADGYMVKVHLHLLHKCRY